MRREVLELVVDHRAAHNAEEREHAVVQRHPLGLAVAHHALLLDDAIRPVGRRADDHLVRVRVTVGVGVRGRVGVRVGVKVREG